MERTFSFLSLFNEPPPAKVVATMKTKGEKKHDDEDTTLQSDKESQHSKEDFLDNEQEWNIHTIVEEESKVNDASRRGDQQSQRGSSANTSSSTARNSDYSDLFQTERVEANKFIYNGTSKENPLGQTALRVIDVNDRLPINDMKHFLAKDTPSFFPKRQVGQFDIFPDDDIVWKIVPSSDESMIAIGSYEGRITIYRLYEGEKGKQMIGRTSFSSSVKGAFFKGPKLISVSALAFSPDNCILAAAWLRKIVLFDTNTGTVICQTDTTQNIYALSFSGNSKRVAIGGETGWAIFKVKALPTKLFGGFKDYNAYYKGDELDELAVVKTLSFCPGDEKLLVGGHKEDYRSGGCFLFDVGGSRGLLTQFCSENINTAVFSPDGMTVAIGCEEKTYLFGTTGGMLIHTFNHGSYDIKFSNDGTRVFNLSRRVISQHDVASGEKLFETHASSRSSFALIGNNAKELLIAVGSEEDHKIQVWKTGSLNANELKHNGECYDAAISNDGQIMVFCCGSNGCIMFDGMGKEIKSFQEIIARTDSRLYDDMGRTITSSSQVTVGRMESRSAAFSSTGDKIAVGGLGKVTLYSVVKKADGFDIEFQKLCKIYHPRKKVEQVIFFKENGQDRIASVSWNNMKTMIDIHTADDIHRRIDSVTIPIKYGRVEMVPKTNQFFVRASYREKYSIYSHEGHLDKTFLDKFDFEGSIKAARFSQDGSKLLVVVRAHLMVYNLLSKNTSAIDVIELSRNNANSIEIVTDRFERSIVAVSFKGGSIDICCFQRWEEGNKLYTIATPYSVNNLFFRPIAHGESIDKEGCELLVTAGSITRSYDIRLSVFSNPTSPFHLLHHCQNEEHFMKQCARSSNTKSIPFHRNQNGDTFLFCAAFQKGYFEYVEQTIEESPKAIFALYCTHRHRHINSGNASSKLEINAADREQNNSIIRQCAEKNQLDRLEQFLFPPELLKYGTTPEKALNEIVSCIETLAKYKATHTLAAILDAGAFGCMPGFVPGYKVWLREPEDYGLMLNWLLKTLKIPRIQDTIASTSIIPPQTSPLSHALRFEDYQNDSEKKIQLNICRVLLPNLASLSVIRPLLDMSEKYEEGSSSLKLFAKRSLRDSINAVWYSWGRTMFLRQLVVYFVWLLCLTALAGMRGTNDDSAASIHGIRWSLIVFVSAGLFYFARVEFMQLKGRRFSQYFKLSWNLQQVAAQVCVFVYIIMELSRPSGDVMTIMFGALSQLLGWINLLYYMRGISENVAWIIFALFRLIGSMSIFLSVLFLSVFACALFFWTLEEPTPTNFRSFGETLLRTAFASFLFSDYDPFEETTADRISSTIILIINIMVLAIIYLVCLNAMIAFISENFADILEDKIAVVAREKANLIIDLYTGMSDSQRQKIEEKNRWTLKLELQSTLDKIGPINGNDEEVANRRATKGDIGDLRIETCETLMDLKSEMEKIKADTEAETEALKSEMQDMKKEVKAELNEIHKLLEAILANTAGVRER